MRLKLSILMALAGALAAAAGAEVIDRIAVSVGSRVITETDLDREIRITAFLNNQKPDFTPANRRKTAERMVDQTLVRSEIEASRYPPPSAAETEAALAEEKARLGDDAAYRRALAAYGIGEDDLKARLTWQLTLLRFIAVRFQAPSTDGQSEDQLMEQWLKEARRRTHIQYHEVLGGRAILPAAAFQAALPCGADPPLRLGGRAILPAAAFQAALPCGAGVHACGGSPDPPLSPNAALLP